MLRGISMNNQEVNSASYFRVQSEREQTLALTLDDRHVLMSTMQLL